MTKEEIEADRILTMFLMETDILSKEIAKQCALLHVQGIIDSDKNILIWLEAKKSEYHLIHGMNRDIEYWNQIKTIIENK